MNDYEIRRQQKIERYKRAAQLCERASDDAHSNAQKMASMIPFGQPILIGHHSENRDRNYRNKILKRFEKSFELSEKAKYYRQKAAAMESNNSISSDDPNAPERIEEKIKKLEEKQEKFKQINKLVRKNDREGLKKIGYSDSLIEKFFTPDFCGRLGIPDFEITNNGANIRRLKQRLEQLKSQAEKPAVKIMVGQDIKIEENAELNRLQIFFPGKPSEEIRNRLKGAGFRWSPSEGAWQRQRSSSALWQAKAIFGLN